MSRPARLFSRALFLGLLLAIGAHAQSTIFNIPSTDVMPEKKIYLETDFIAHFDKYSKGGFQTYGYRMVYGVTKRVEAGVNFFYTRDGSTSPKELQFNGKYQVYNNEEHGVGVSVGGWAFVPVNRSSGRRVTGMVFANVSKKFSKLKGLRLTGGVYQMVRTERNSGSKRGFMVGIEQPIVGNLSFTGDWFSGNNKLGIVTAGLSYTFATRHFVQIGYAWGNNGRGNNAFQAFYGVTF